MVIARRNVSWRDAAFASDRRRPERHQVIRPAHRMIPPGGVGRNCRLGWGADGADGAD